MIRKVISDELKVPWNDIQLKRTERGKPYLMNKDSYNSETFPNFNFNVSHSGSYVVLAAERAKDCGIDVMDATRPGRPTYLTQHIERYQLSEDLLSYRGAKSQDFSERSILRFLVFWNLLSEF